MEQTKSTANILARRLKSGDADAFECIYSAYFSKITFYASQYLTDREVVKEVAQDVFLVIWQKREEVDPSLDLLPYLLTIARNKCLSILRKQLVERKYHQKMLSPLEMANYMALCHQSSDVILSDELQAMISDVMDSFPEDTRKTFHMSRSENLTYEEIAQKMDVSVSTVEYRMMKALKQFRKKLKDYLPILLLLGNILGR